MTAMLAFDCSAGADDSTRIISRGSDCAGGKRLCEEQTTAPLAGTFYKRRLQNLILDDMASFCQSRSFSETALQI